MNIPEKLQSILNNLPLLASEIFLTLSFVLLIVVELFLFRKNTTLETKADSQNWLWGFCLAIVLFSAYIVVNQTNMVDFNSDSSAFFRIDNTAIFFKIIVIIASIIFLVHIKIKQYLLPNDFYPLFIFQLIGLFLLTIATNFLLIYIAIEIVSIASYIYAAIALNKKASEAAIKYALFGGISSAIMLYGISLLYGITGTLDILNPEFTRNLSQIDQNALIIVVLLAIGGFLFKVSAFPFHLWVADVFEATPTAIASFLSIAPKAAGFLILSRFVAVLPNAQLNVIIIISIFSIAIGNFSALRQVNVKRMLAFSTVAQSGFIIGALACLSNIGFQSAFFYLFGYIFANMLAFFMIDFNNNKLNIKLVNFEDFKGIGTKFPVWGLIVILTMISLIGLPPTVGFSGKLFVFSALWESYQLTSNKLILLLFLFGLANTAISLYFYLKLPFYAFFRKAPENQYIIFSLREILFALILSVPILLYFFKADYLMNWIGNVLK